MPTPVMEKEADTKKVSQQAKDYWRLQWIINAVRNYPIITRSHGVRFLEGACQGIPAFIVGIGPSLDQNIRELKQADGRAIIIATDAATRPLLANGVKPHIVITFDCDANQPALWDLMAPHNTIPMLVNSCSNPKVLQTWSGPMLFYNQWHKDDPFVEEVLPIMYAHLGSLPSLGTVGNLAIMLAHKMGCNPLFTVGMDLCYQGNAQEALKYRCTDWEWKRDQMDIYAWRQLVDKRIYDNDKRIQRAYPKEYKGGRYWTDPELDAYHTCLLGTAEALKLNLIDCSAGGVLKYDFNKMSIKEALDKHCINELSQGRTVLYHLHDIVKDGRHQWREDSKNGAII